MFARTLPKNGSQETGGSLVPARTLPEKGSQKMVLFFSAPPTLYQKSGLLEMDRSLAPARTLPEKGSRKMVICLVSARTLPKNGSQEMGGSFVPARTECILTPIYTHLPPPSDMRKRNLKLIPMVPGTAVFPIREVIFGVPFAYLRGRGRCVF